MVPTPEGNWDALSILEGCLLRYPRVEGREHALDNWLPPLLGFGVGNKKQKNKNEKKMCILAGFPSSLPSPLPSTRLVEFIKEGIVL